MKKNTPTIKELKQKAKKECWSKVDYMWHYLGLYAARPLLKTGITPNQVTAFWILLELLAAILMLGSYWYRISALIIANFIVNLLDFTDGNIARIKGPKTLLGIYLDRLGIFVGMPLLMLFLGTGIWLREENLAALILGGVCCIAMLYEKLFSVNPAWYSSAQWPPLQEIYRESSLSKKNIFSFFSELFRKAQPFNILFFGIVLDQLIITLWIYAIISILAMLRKLVSQVKAIRRFDKQ